jgi:hypothetical protein
MVKKAAQAIPNQLLRRARLERIGAPNHMMVTRWERGKAFPSPYYVERLCQLFRHLFQYGEFNRGVLNDGWMGGFACSRAAIKVCWTGFSRFFKTRVADTIEGSHQCAGRFSLCHPSTGISRSITCALSQDLTRLVHELWPSCMSTVTRCQALLR